MKQREVRDIVLSMLVIAIAFAWPGFPLPALTKIALTFAAVIIAVGTGFILHELAHKYTAIHYGCHSEYFAWPYGLALALALSFLTNGGFVFAAPGAVYIAGEINRRQNGIISIAGPLVNILLAILFFVVLAFVVPLLASNVEIAMIAATIAFIGMRVNFFLAAFNLLPFGPLDGTKVISWNPIVWGILFVPSAVIAFMPWLVF